MTDRGGTKRDLSLGPGTVREAVIEELRGGTRVLAPQLAELVRATDEPFVQVIIDLEVPQMVFGRVCLIGDAAFAVRPHAAAGTAKAAEDAWSLAAALSSHGADLGYALSEWERERLRVGRFVVDRSRRMGDRSQNSCTWRPQDQELRFGLHGPHR